MNTNSHFRAGGNGVTQIGNLRYEEGVAARHVRRSEQGSAVLVVIALLSIILIYVAYNIRMLDLLRQDVRLVEKAQLRRLDAAGGKTNVVQKVEFQVPNTVTNIPIPVHQAQ